MSDDDDLDCPGHDWRMQGVTAAGDGAHLDYACPRCGAVMVEVPDQLRGQA